MPCFSKADLISTFYCNVFLLRHLQIYTQVPATSLFQAVFTINKDLELILQWSNNSFGLHWTYQVIVIGSSRMQSKIDWNCIPQVRFNGTRTSFFDTAKNLCITINCQLSWRSYIAQISRRIFLSSRSLRKLRNFMPIATRLAESLFLPVLD